MDTCPYVSIPYVSVHPNSINVFKRIEWIDKKKYRPKFKHLLESDRNHNGKVSAQANRKVSKAVDYMLFMAKDKKIQTSEHGRNFKFKICFVTLTLPSAQIHSDNEIKSACLNQFLIEAKKKWHVINYVWRAEKQMNGSIHFHVLTDKFIPWSELRDVWNRIVNKLGYVDRYRDEMKKFHSEGFRVRSELLQKWEYKAQVKAYQTGKANDWSSPNSTDVHSIKQVSNVRKYVLKYTTKDEKNGPVSGRMWGCSVDLSNIPGAQDIIAAEIYEEIGRLKKEFPDSMYEAEYFTTFSLPVQLLKSIGCNALYMLFSKFLIDRFDYHIQTEIIG